jgi:hypothetical protein
MLHITAHPVKLLKNFVELTFLNPDAKILNAKVNLVIFYPGVYNYPVGVW